MAIDKINLFAQAISGNSSQAVKPGAPAFTSHSGGQQKFPEDTAMGVGVTNWDARGQNGILPNGQSTVNGLKFMAIA